MMGDRGYEDIEDGEREPECPTGVRDRTLIRPDSKQFKLEPLTKNY